jgi:hypothetical protein
MKLVSLTRPDGSSVWVNPDMVVSVARAVPGIYQRGAVTEIILLSEKLPVVEAPEDVVVALIAEALGKH